MHNTGTKKHPGSQCGVTGSPELFGVCKTSANLRLAGAHSLLKAFSSSKRDISGYHVNCMWRLKELHSKILY